VKFLVVSQVLRNGTNLAMPILFIVWTFCLLLLLYLGAWNKLLRGRAFKQDKQYIREVKKKLERQAGCRMNYIKEGGQRVIRYYSETITGSNMSGV
jgi:hypothetical protein